MKPPPQNPKEIIPSAGPNGRKASISQVPTGAAAHNVQSPSARLGARRRETSDSYQIGAPLTSPSATRFLKDDNTVSTPTSSLLRRKTDIKDSISPSSFGDRMKDINRQDHSAEHTSPFTGLKRTTTGPLNTDQSSSLWASGSQAAGFSPMGAFGNFSLGAGSSPLTPVDKKSGLGSMRSESRFKGLMSKDSSDDAAPGTKEKGPIQNLDKKSEMAKDKQTSIWGNNQSGRPISADSNPYGNEEQITGSSALAGDDDHPSSQYHSRINEVEGPRPHDDIGFSSLGASEEVQYQELLQRQGYGHQLSSHNQQAGFGLSHEPMSPTDTNPYQSPEGEKALPDKYDNENSNIYNSQFLGLGGPGEHSKGVAGFYENAVSDRSQTSSTGPSRPFPSLGGLGGFGGPSATGPWSAAPGAIGTPSKAPGSFGGTFGDSIFGPLGDLQSAGQGVPSYFGAPIPSQLSVGAFSRGSKMGSLFPAAMQDQMRRETSRNDQNSHDLNDSQERASTNAPGFGALSQDQELQSRGVLDDLFSSLDSRKGGQNISSPFGSSEGTNLLNQSTPLSSQAPFSMGSSAIGTQSLAAPASNTSSRRTPEEKSGAYSSQMPATQQRQMVMPDRMRWIYRDPQGNTQGPWSGLEMHDWYKAGFFSPELQVKKMEDSEYEPLAQLIRRIGNSREPFLVPQIGIPHGSSTALPGSSIAPVLGSVAASSPGIQSTAQPPFAGSFPSFGTTLTAEQQNALERRKQEEQYLMARQKEHLAQQQVMIKQMQHMQGGPHGLHSGQLHHHSSAHSLQSQPSYGSITSPSGYQVSPAQVPVQPPGGIPGSFEAQLRTSNPGPGSMAPSGESSNAGRDNEVASSFDRLNLGRGGLTPYGSILQSQCQQDNQNQQQHQISAMLHDRARLQQEQDQYEYLQQKASDDGMGTVERLEQFHQLQPQDGYNRTSAAGDQLGQNGQLFHEHGASDPTVESLSLSEQVQKAAIAKESPVVAQSTWGHVERGLPQPFPPPQSISPLPAPSAQRNRHNVADALNAESRSQSQTPSVETPSAALAPWAKENSEGPRGPSLKEIQETEAKKAAEQDQLAAASRRALAEQERQNQVQTSAPAPGLPSTAGWARGGSPGNSSSAGAASAWTKPASGKPSVATPVTTTKKTLAQIQKEEESRKQRAATAAAANAANTTAPVTASGGKRYADLAGKIAAPPLQGPGGAWTTVGAGGKLKALNSPSATAPAQRSVSGGLINNITPVAKPKPTLVPIRSATIGSSISGQSNAIDEFQKWAKGALGKGLNSGINGE